jgi:uncharacterized protein with HEPN domain
MKRNQEIFVWDILKSIESVEKFTENITIEFFCSDREKQNAVIREFEIIGEAAKHVSAELKRKYPEILWPKMIGMRNRLIHEYFGLNLERIWKTAKEDLPMLKTQIAVVLDELNKNKLIK